MKFDIHAMSKEQIEEFKSKGTWYLARGVELFKTNNHEWKVKELTAEDIENRKHRAGTLFQDNLKYFTEGYNEYYGWDEDEVYVNVCGLFDNEEEATKWLKEYYLEDVYAQKKHLENLLAKVNDRINTVMKDWWDDFDDNWKLHY